MVSYKGNEITLRKTYKTPITNGYYAKSFNGLIVILNSDEKTVVEQYYCESDCCKNNGLSGFCDGEFEITKDTKKRVCRRYWNPSNI